MALPSYLPLDSFAPSMKLSYDLAFNAFSLGRISAINEVKEWVKKESCGRHNIVIHTDDLLTKLNNLKQ